ncbi:MAG TPA: FlgD immunoglobulin-like domain containing protein, partial [Candidatus Cloacimonadota bacterium]|nr:FlgD immunoglobulin-like domain containing protein [Candidatus Cloacimonadota bacterium]
AGTFAVDYGYKIACDNANNCYITGSAGEGANFSGTFLNGYGMFAAKYDSLGNLAWLAPSQNAFVISIAVQPDAGAGQKGAVCGRVVGSGSIGSFSFDSLDGSDDAYWAEFDAHTGAWQSFTWGGGLASDKGRDCFYTGNSPNPLIAATFEENAVFGLQNLVSLGDCDLVIGYGDSQFVVAGGANLEIGHAICGLPNGSIAVAGWHFGDCHFGSLVIDSGNSANQNGFVALYNPNTSVEDVTQPRQSLKAWPNPFRDQIKINSMGRSEELAVFNLKGQLVKKLTPHAVNKGQISSSWDGHDLSGLRCPPGIYLIRQSQNSTKVVLMH